MTPDVVQVKALSDYCLEAVFYSSDWHNYSDVKDSQPHPYVSTVPEHLIAAKRFGRGNMPCPAWFLNGRCHKFAKFIA